MEITQLHIGVGCTTTFTRPKTFKLWLKQFHKHTSNLPEGCEITYHVQSFYPQKHKSIAQVKNLCINELLSHNVDYLFLFDDDCFPIRDDWYVPFIQASIASGNEHFCWIKDDSKLLGEDGRKHLYTDRGISVFRGTQGCCVFLTANAARQVQYDESFTGYGFEHEDVTVTCYKLGLNKMDGCLSTPDIHRYIYSLDIQGVQPYINQLGGEVFTRYGIPFMKSAMNAQNRKFALDRNREIFNNKHNMQVK